MPTPPSDLTLPIKRLVTFSFPPSPSPYVSGYAVKIARAGKTVVDTTVSETRFTASLPEGAEVVVEVRAHGAGRVSEPSVLTYKVPLAPLDPPGPITAEIPGGSNPAA